MTKQRLLRQMLAGICFLLLFQLARAQNKVITGVVLDDKGGPLSGATVRVPGSAKGVNTDADGKFTLSAPPEATTLAITYVGYYQTYNLGANPLTFNARCYAWPIPVVEINANSKVAGEQNPGY